MRHAQLMLSAAILGKQLEAAQPPSIREQPPLLGRTATEIATELSSLTKPMSPCKRIKCKIFAPGNKTFESLYVEAPKGKAMSHRGVDNAIQTAAEAVEAKYPGHDYRMVQTKDSYNFIWVQETPTVPERIVSFSNLDDFTQKETPCTES